MGVEEVGTGVVKKATYRICFLSSKEELAVEGGLGLGCFEYFRVFLKIGLKSLIKL